MNEELDPYNAALLQSVRAIHRAATFAQPVFDPEEGALALLHLEELKRRVSPPPDDVSVTGEQLMSGRSWEELLSECLGFVLKWEAGLRVALRDESGEEVLQELAAARAALEAAIADVRRRGG